MRKRIFQIVDSSEAGDKLGNAYDIFMLIAIICSLIPLCTKSEAQWTIVVDLVTVSVFIVDYILREITADLKYPELHGKAFVRYPFSFMAIIDLLSIIPSFGVFSQGMKVLKVFRLFKTMKVFKTMKALKAFKAFKLFRYSKSIDLIATVIKMQKEALLTVGGLAFGYILIASLVIFNVEPDSFDNFFEAIYWATVSLTTVGYGDVYPVTTAGRIVTMLSSFVGIAIVALPAGIITAGYMEALQKSKEEES